MSEAAPGASLARLVAIMDRLLAPDGCPWDREQTLQSLRPFLVEETYEVLDAIARDVPADHCEELGDLLMQIVFQAAIRRAEGRFDIDAVVAGISDKLVRRHPHIFSDTAGIETPAQVLEQWDQIKAREKAQKGERDKRVLGNVPAGPALQRAQKIGGKAGKVGFDWPGWTGSYAKIDEEVGELRAAAEATPQNPTALHHELGDLLLAVVNVARKLGVDAENALLDATRRFETRFAFIEDRLADAGKTPLTSNLDEMDSLWNAAKVALADRET